MSSTPQRFEEYREWLKKVLYYNTIDSEYWCADVNEILGTFSYFNDRGEPDLLGRLAVLKYLKESGKCSKLFVVENYESVRSGTLATIYNHWKDTTQDTSGTRPDSSLPTIEELDLTILYGPSKVVHDFHSQSEILALSAKDNPFKQEIELRYELASGSSIRIELLDQLGRSMFSEVLGWQTYGKKYFTIRSSHLDGGVYYARLSTLKGEVKTLKLIKE
jgi:hypothetical protein